MADIATQPIWQVLDGNGTPYPGALARFYISGTTTPLTAYTDIGLSVAHAVPVVADANGVFPPIYLGATAAKVVITSSTGAAIKTIDPVPRSSASATGASQVSFSPTPDIPSLNVQDAIEQVQTNLDDSSTAFAKTLLDDTTASDMLSTLGVSTFVKTLLDDASALAFLTTLGFGVAGSAPFYLPRAWVIFTGTGTVTIRASGNVSSITDNGTGDYTINFATAMADANYSYSVQAGVVGTSNTTVYAPKMTNMTASALTILTLSNGVAADFPTVSVVVFR